MLTTQIKKQVNIFGFSKLCKFLFGFSFANFYFVSCKFMKAVKIEFDTSYLSWGSSPKLASGLLLLVGVEPSPTVVGPPLLLSLLLLSLHVVDPLACVSLPVLS